MVVPVRPDALPIRTLLLRVFLPAVAIVAILLGLLTYNRLYSSILDGFDRKLITISALTGALIDARDHDRLIAIARSQPKDDTLERSRAYQDAVLPMRRIRSELDITYLYTQIFGGSQDIIYVLDSTEGDDHSPIGSEDELPPETLAGLHRVAAQGTIHLSPIEYQEQWGLLKTAAAPLRGADGRIVATAGADVNISLIQVATQNALFTSAVIGMVSLLACTLVILMIVRRIAQPLDRLRQEALRIAGGDHRPPADFPAPRDITRLRTALAKAAAAMTSRLAQARNESAATERRTALAALDADLRRRAPGLAVPIADNPDRLVIACCTGNDRHALLQRAALARLAARSAADPSIAEQWQPLVAACAAPVIVLDRRGGELRWTGDTPLDLIRGDGTPLRLEPGLSCTLDRGETATLMLADGTPIPLGMAAAR